MKDILQQRQLEDEAKEADIRLQLYKARYQLQDIRGLNESLSKCRETQLKGDDMPDLKKQMVRWLDWLETIGEPDINRMLKENRYKDMFVEPRPEDIRGEADPRIIMEQVKGQMYGTMVEQCRAIDRLRIEIPELEEKERRLRYDRRTLKYAQQGARFTIYNIILTIMVPVLIFLSTFIAESFKPEIASFIRGLFGLPPLP